MAGDHPLRSGMILEVEDGVFSQKITHLATVRLAQAQSPAGSATEMQCPIGFSMIEHVQSSDVLEKCTKDILSIIKPTEDDRNKRLHVIQEIVNSISLVGGLGDAAVKPFGSFLSELYTKSGDLDVSVELPNVSGFSTSKEKKQNLLRELMKALQISGVARDVNFIPTARVPVLQYVKEWAKAQNINDPKNGTLNSYSLCLLVLFHFQTCKPAILPSMKEFFDFNILGEIGPYNEKIVDEICARNIAKFRRQNIGQRNQSSLSHLLATFFEKLKIFSLESTFEFQYCLQFGRIVVHSSEVVSTYTGRLLRKQGGLYWMTKSYCLFDPKLVVSVDRTFFEIPRDACKCYAFKEDEEDHVCEVTADRVEPVPDMTLEDPTGMTQLAVVAVARSIVPESHRQWQVELFSATMGAS
ncbi:hypothetical protein VPH35_061562 [Triticum aestivum]|uniref:Poly(A) RNA polymerase mitochondrial-like central palm domain-containing protein n=1 Tax=Aegilops tauschii TaxID=37682 RepID=M8B967_AEGTA